VKPSRAHEIAKLPVSPEEEAEIMAGALTDPDNPPWPDEFLDRMRPTAEVSPETIEHARRHRGPQKAPTKVQLNLRLDAEVVAHFQGARHRLADTDQRGIAGERGACRA
jgi:uncharacterized protein (DUF4415 family)